MSYEPSAGTRLFAFLRRKRYLDRMRTEDAIEAFFEIAFLPLCIAFWAYLCLGDGSMPAGMRICFALLYPYFAIMMMGNRSSGDLVKLFVLTQCFIWVSTWAYLGADEGEPIYRLIQDIDGDRSHYLSSIMLLLGLYVLCNGVISSTRITVRGSLPRREQMGYQFAGKDSPLTQIDIWSLSVHEASHAVMNAVSGAVPLKASIELDYSKQNINGSFCPFYTGYRSHSFAVHELSLLTLLAGVEGEKLFAKTRCLSGGQDYHQWRIAAGTFLLCSSDAIYYAGQTNSYEFNHNVKMLADLKARQQDVVRRCLIRNGAIVLQLAEELRKHGVVNGQYLRDALLKVEPVEGCPVFSEELKAAMKRDVELCDQGKVLYEAAFG
ncbi:hypothetical protein ACYPKM_04585 [Pseudomonas aeruginosa]